MSQTGISAIIPCYNSARYVTETIISLLHQTRPPDEIIVVDDGSSDDSAAIVEAIASQHPSVRLIRQTNRGGARARLAGYQAAQYPLLYFIDADDVAAPDTLERLAAALAKNSKAVISYGNAQMVDAALRPLTPLPKHPKPSGDILLKQLKHNQIVMGSALIRASALAPETMDHDIKVGQDLIMWAQLCAAGAAQYVSGAPMVFYRKHEHNVTRRHLVAPERYLAYIDWIFAYDPIVSQLTNAQLTKLRTRRIAAAHSFIAKTALMQDEQALARVHARSALRLEPLNLRLYALALVAMIGKVPAAARRHLFD